MARSCPAGRSGSGGAYGGDERGGEVVARASVREVLAGLGPHAWAAAAAASEFGEGQGERNTEEARGWWRRVGRRRRVVCTPHFCGWHVGDATPAAGGRFRGAGTPARSRRRATFRTTLGDGRELPVIAAGELSVHLIRPAGGGRSSLSLIRLRGWLYLLGRASPRVIGTLGDALTRVGRGISNASTHDCSSIRLNLRVRVAPFDVRDSPGRSLILDSIGRNNGPWRPASVGLDRCTRTAERIVLSPILFHGLFLVLVILPAGTTTLAGTDLFPLFASAAVLRSSAPSACLASRICLAYSGHVPFLQMIPCALYRIGFAAVFWVWFQWSSASNASSSQPAHPTFPTSSCPLVPATHLARSSPVLVFLLHGSDPHPVKFFLHRNGCGHGRGTSRRSRWQ